MGKRYKNNKCNHVKVLNFFEEQKKFICDFEEVNNAACSMEVYRLCDSYTEKARRLLEKLNHTSHSLLGL